MFILTEKYGRLCNRLMLTAHVLACAIEHDHSFYNLAFYDYAKHFQAQSEDFFCRYPIKANWLKNQPSLGKIIYKSNFVFSSLISDHSKEGYLSEHFIVIRSDGDHSNHTDLNLDTDPRLLNISERNQIVFFRGWYMRGYKNLEKHGDKVREYFKPLDIYQQSVDSLLTKLKQNTDVLIGVVVRHGDYKQYLDGKYYYPLEAYINFMRQMKAFFPNRKVSFLICSDEEQDTTALKEFEFFFRSGHMIENLYSLAGCDYIITPRSTYGMWASFYGKTPFCVLENPEQVLALEDFKVCQL